MTPSSISGKMLARAKRREVFWNRLTFVVGCAAVVGIIAAIVAVASQKIMKGPSVDDSYLRISMRQADEKKTWSGRTKSEPAQFEVMRSAASRIESEHKAAPSPDAAKLIDKALGTQSKALPMVSGIEDIDLKKDKIGQIVRGFFAARTIAGKLPFVRDPERVKPLMEDFYSREPMPDLAYRSLGKVVRVEEPGYRLGYVQALFESGNPITLIIEERVEGEFRVDWECVTRYGEMSWLDFMAKRPTQPRLMRVKASLPATAPAADPRMQWLDLRYAADSSSVLASFNREDPRLASLLDQLNQGKWQDVPLTLSLAFEPASDQGASSKVTISGVTGKGWLILAP